VRICHQCGQENPEVAKFCLACGTPLGKLEPLPGEERKVVTALFTDIVGSTASAEHMDPEDVWARLALYHVRVRRELESFGGTVEKFIGDAVVALFGAPIAHEDDPERAVRAAIAIRTAVEELNAEEEWLNIHIRTAVHTGQAFVIPSASADKGEMMAAGDVMNTAARLQSGAPVDGIVVGEATYRATSTIFDYRAAEPVQAKGKAEPIPIWEVVAEREAPEQPAARAPFVGRSTELALLSELWAKARDEKRPHLVTVLGPPGIGKSRLLLALNDSAEKDGTAHWGRCLPYGEGITYWPVTEILKSAAGIRHDDDPAAISAKLGALLESLPSSDLDELRTMAAAAANLLGVATTPLATYSAEEIGQSELHWGVRRVLQLLAAGSPLLLVFEDLHWAEPTLVELIRSLADLEGEAPILVVGSARPELKDASPPMVSSGGNRRVVELDPLSEDESHALLVELVGEEAIGGGPLETLLTNAGGNPLFLEETVRMLADAELDPDLSPDALPVPDNLQALIGSRLDALPTSDKRVAQQASVVGGVFWESAVAHLDGARADLSDSLATLERRDFVQVQEESSIASDDEYAFKHILIRDVAYDRLPKGRRAELHARFTEWLAGLPGPEGEFIEIVAYHLEQACLLAGQIARSPIEPPVLEATDALAHAAEKAERREGIREANRFYARALALLGDHHPERRLELRLQIGRTLAQLGDLKEACEELEWSAEAARAAVRYDLLCEALVRLGNIDQRRGRPSEARAKLEEAEILADRVDDVRLRIRAAFSVSALRADFEGDAEGAISELRRALTLAEQLGDTLLSVEGHLRLGYMLFNTGDFAASETELTRCYDLAEGLGSRRDQARATFPLGLIKYYRGDLDEAQRLGLQARDWLQRTAEAYFQIQNFRALGLYALARDEPASAEEWFRQAIPIALEEGGRFALEVYRWMTEALVKQGRLTDATRLVEFAARSVPPEDLSARAYVNVATALVASERGEREAALHAYSEALRLFADQNVPIDLGETRILFARALRRFQEPAEARTQLELAHATFSEIGALGLVAAIDRETEELAGEVGRADPARSSSG
jgi:class 3 adenylate cyclase/tetratricopeptide (TPR) repeat protein